MQYETDEERLEAIKRWWKDNGTAIIAGALIGLGLIWGWRLWIGHQQQTATQASVLFEQLILAASDKQTEAVLKHSAALADAFGSTAYPALGALVAAKVLYEAGQVSEAMNQLQRAIDQAPDPAIARLAALRLARIQFAENQVEAAAKTIERYDTSPAFAADFAAVRGDIALTRGDRAAAESAYQRAIELGSPLAMLIRLKLDSLLPQN
ncbi:tetratricopeptide repeat protein [Caldichromatium japonicum]|uniref:Ancillary SecYEG translocon subunit n=1 Tax=Caldichromatium japonicum TaxID=2699430 RepID=A0A6G7VBY6_9GAMM|nr:tetratricopeptide repeat protein [Caldichromatium japonicum]QIK37420.1 tetratricopeptide repeat protein [Caldichromatium japonicum]